MLQTLGILAQRVKECRIAVIGDAMLDENIEGHVQRISPEAPVPLLSKQRRRVLPGGAANVASGIAALGARCTFIGLVGDDPAAQELRTVLQERYQGLLEDKLVVDPSRPTTVKTRYWGTGYGGPKYLLLRADEESTVQCEGSVKQSLLGLIADLRPSGEGRYGAIVVSDYAKGVIDSDIIQAASATHVPIIIAPKPSRHASIRERLRGVNTVLPNFNEAVAIAGQYGVQTTEVSEVARTLQQHLDANIVITQGKKGIYALARTGEVYTDSAQVREIYDVTGAGDVVLATYAVCACASLPLQDAIKVANRAGGIKVGKVGVATVSIDELMRNAGAP